MFSFLRGSLMDGDTWNPLLDGDTTALSYWLNWRFFTCAAFVLLTMLFAAVLIWKYEGSKERDSETRDQQRVGHLYEYESWMTCLKVIHPGWLLGYRIISFVILFTLITANVVVGGWGIFFFYTQLTFLLVTIYFALGSAISIHGFCKRRSGSDGHVSNQDFYSERDDYLPLRLGESSNTSYSPKLQYEYRAYGSQTAGVVGYSFQIIFQICAGAVVLTDTVFWFILYPLINSVHFKLNFMNFCMHSLNVVFLLGDVLLNGLRFPMFRIAYFILWTGVFVIFQWIFHACVDMWWPYPFLELSMPYAPAWYVAVGVMHIPCYCVFALIIKLKYFWLSRAFPESYQGYR